MQAVTEETSEPEPVTAADDFKIEYRTAARDALSKVQQELVTKQIEQKVKLEQKNEKIQEKLNAFEASEVKETKEPSSLSKKTKCDLWADVRNGATRKHNTVNKFSCGASGDQEPK